MPCIEADQVEAIFSNVEREWYCAKAERHRPTFWRVASAGSPMRSPIDMTATAIEIIKFIPGDQPVGAPHRGER
jgi:hypothetical protein